MRQRLLANRSLLVLALLALALKLFSLNETWVEKWYSTGLYPVLSKIFRYAFGWLPFSIGDIAYIAAGIWLVVKAWRLLKRIKRRKAVAISTWAIVSKLFRLLLIVYILFSVEWGLNYSRQGVAAQLGFTLQPYTVNDLWRLATIMNQRVNTAAQVIDSVERLRYNQNSFLFDEGERAYSLAKGRYPFLDYSPASIKPSLFTLVGHWFGFTGYYNPFSGEAQLKTDIPVFLKPFVVTHEVAHQLGYAKENEASFVGYLACKQSGNQQFLYSAYFETYRDALYECLKSGMDSLKINSLRRDLHPRVKNDIADLRAYSLRNRNMIEPFMTGAYDRYLKLNNQPAGRATYNEVIAYLIAYAKRFGWDAL